MVKIITLLLVRRNSLLTKVDITRLTKWREDCLVAKENNDVNTNVVVR